MGSQPAGRGLPRRRRRDWIQDFRPCYLLRGHHIHHRSSLYVRILLKDAHPFIMENEKWFVIALSPFSTVVMTLLGQPATLLVLAGAVNGLILPLTLLTVLAASRNKKIVGENYKHPTILLVLGIVAVVLTGIGAVRSLPNILTIFG